jgi:hypothetical protein
VTWAKFGTEFRAQMIMAGLPDAAVRTHYDALVWLYEIESADMRIPKPALRMVTGTADPDRAAGDLGAVGFWRDDGDSWTVLHHADVFRQSLAAQLAHREKEKFRQRRKRGSGANSVGANVGANVRANVRATQTDRQSRPAPKGNQVKGPACEVCGEPLRVYRDGKARAHPSCQMEPMFTQDELS